MEDHNTVKSFKKPYGLYEKFEDIIEVIRSHKSKNDRQHKGQMVMFYLFYFCAIYRNELIDRITHILIEYLPATIKTTPI